MLRARILFRSAGFTTVSVFALALGIGINTAAFTAYEAFVARPLDARDAGRVVNFALRLQSGATNARFSYPDYEAYGDHRRSFSGVIAFSIDQLRFSGALGINGHRSAETGSLIGRLGLQRPASNMEFASAFIVSENYFSVLGVTAPRGRTFESISGPELAASPSVLISGNYWRRRFAGNPAVLGKSVRLNGAAFTIAGITPHNFIGTSVVVPDFWLLLRLDPLVHPQSSRLHNREDLCCRVFGRPARRTAAMGGEPPSCSMGNSRRPKIRTQRFTTRGYRQTISRRSAFHCGLVLASMGIYGTVSYVVVLRTREVGIRMAIGAQKRDIHALVIRGSISPVIAGLPVGMVLAVGASQLLRGAMYGLSTIDPISFAGASVLSLAIALAATWPPSRRATRVGSDDGVAIRVAHGPSDHNEG